jgi:hypothetical protein
MFEILRILPGDQASMPQTILKTSCCSVQILTMKYTTEIQIALPRDRVIALFNSTENLFKWQEGLLRFDHLEGEAGQEGARSTLVYQSRRGELTMTETIVKNKFPHEFHTLYEAKGVYNEMYNYFEPKGPDATTWRTVSVFKFSGLMAIMAPFMKKAFTSNTQLNMERFKSFAESQN